MKLYHSINSPYVRKVMVMAHEAGLAGKIEMIDVAVSPVKPTPEVEQGNPLGKVPTLILDDGSPLFDSRVICEYLDSIHNGTKLFPANGTARWVALRQQALADGILDAALLARYEVFVRPKEFQWKDWEGGQIRKVRGAIAALAGKLKEGALSGQLTIGQVAVACALEYVQRRFPEESAAWRKSHAGLAGWYDEFAKRPSMVATAVK